MLWPLGLAVVAVWVAVPLVAPRSVVDLLVFAALYSIAGLGVSFLLGRCGIVTLGQGVFYGVGAYSIAFFCARLGLPSLVGILAGVAISAGVALAVGWPVLWLTGYYLALATLSLGVIGSVLFLEWSGLTGGTLGIGGLPAISLLGWELNSPQRFYYFIWPIVLACVWLQRNLSLSRGGLAMRAMRDSAEAASQLGVNTHVLKVQMFILSAVFGSIAGSLFAHYVSFISVHSFGVDRAISFLLLAILGGIHTDWGSVLGAVFITVVPEMLSRFGDIHAVLFAGALIAAVILLPEGFGGAIERVVREKVVARNVAARTGVETGATGTPNRPAGGTVRVVVAGEGATARTGALPLLEVREVSRSFRGLQVLQRINLAVPADTIVGLIGPNGSGKTTLFNIISGFLEPDSGRIRYDGRDITDETVQQRSYARLVRTFQTPKVFHGMSVLENLMVGVYKETQSSVVENMLRLPRSLRELREMRAQAEWACAKFGLTAARDLPAGKLPGGQQRLLELARAYLSRPRLLLLDEPSSGLTSEEIKHLMDLLRSLNAEGITIFLVSHHMNLVSVASEINVLYFGEIIAQGSMNDIQKDPKVREAYLGV